MNELICPSCGPESSVTFVAHGLIAPWISEMIGKTPFQKTKLLECDECQLRFFSYRFDSSELAAIYSRYRESKYFSARNRWEPWYTAKENDLYKPSYSNSNVVSRKENMRFHLTASGVTLKQNLSVLDFGGDQGQFFPDEAFERNLYEQSNPENHQDTNSICISAREEQERQNLTSGIRRVTNLNQLKEQDLVMVCGVLEHLSRLSETLDDIGKTLKSSESYLYVEVPLDCPKTNFFHRSQTYFRYLSGISTLARRYPVVFICLDFVTGLFRNFGRPVPLFGIVKQSEHINYFTSSSLRRLLNMKFHVIEIFENSRKKHGKFRLGELVAVCKN